MKTFKEDLSLIEDNLNILIEDIDHPIVKNETKRLISTGGKRLRPLFLLWSAKVNNSTDEKSHRAAAALELLHTSSLIHDDIIDRSYLRRGSDTTLKVFGRERATSIGTVLSLFAIGQIGNLDNKDISETLATTLENLCHGEIKQLEERYDFSCTYDDYLEKISHKTASLFALPCKIGGILGGLQDESVEKLYKVGFNIGCSFQILDDIKDITSTEEISGKSCSNDIKTGVITLPYLLLMEKDSLFKEKVLSLTPDSSLEEFHEVVDHLKSTDVIEQSYIISNNFLDEATNILSTMNSKNNFEEFNYIINKFYRR